MIFRNRQGQVIARAEAEFSMKVDGLEVASDVFDYEGQRVMVRSRLQPVCDSEDEPLFLTMVFGDIKRGVHELPTNSEHECRQLHRGLVERYLLIEHERRLGMPQVLVDGAL